jgi:hypothetical protein
MIGHRYLDGHGMEYLVRVLRVHQTVESIDEIMRVVILVQAAGRESGAGAGDAEAASASPGARAARPALAATARCTIAH